MSRPIIVRDVVYHGERTDLLVSGGVVIPAPEVPPQDAEIVDGVGLVASPGPLVDFHAHFRDPGLTTKEDIVSGARAAAAGGYGVVACEPNTRPVIDTAEAVTAFRERVAALAPPVSVYTKAAVTLSQRGEQATDVAALVNARAVALSDDGEPVLDMVLLVRALRESARLTGNRIRVTAHCEETPASAPRARDLFGDGAPYMREAALIRLHLAALAEAGAGQLHIQHVSLAESAVLIAEAKRRGLPVTAEVTPHHLLLCAEDIPRAGGPDPNWKMNPPLRSRQDMLAMRRALAEGVIDIIATDHAPHTAEEKARAWEDAPFGIVGLETALGACMTLVHDGSLTLERLLDAMCTAPWRLLPSWAQSGADSLTLIDPWRRWTVEPEQFQSKGRNTPFAGMTFTGKAMMTIARGRVVMRDGEVFG